MPTEHNKGRAEELFRLLQGKHTPAEWVPIFARILAFLLNRYINED